MEDFLVRKGYIPFDKSFFNRVGVPDLLNGYSSTVRFLGPRYNTLSDDLKALYHASLDWRAGIDVDVNESGTLYRFLQFASWKFGLDKKFVMHGTLEKRKMCDDPSIVNYSLQELLELPEKTSQWASAKVTTATRQEYEKLKLELDEIENPLYKLKLSFEVRDHWTEMRSKKKCWEPRYDETILKQAIAFLKILKYCHAEFTAEQPEDYCFARRFNYITKEEGESRWPSLKEHESNRIKEMEKIIRAADSGLEIESNDHRAVQAYAMMQTVAGQKINMKECYKDSVSKSWPQFWKFLDHSDYLIRYV